MSETELVQFDRAKLALAQAATVDEVKKIRDQAEALRAYYRQTTDGLEMQNQCAAIKLRAERRAGEMLAEIERAPGKREGGTSYQDVMRSSDIQPMQSHRFQQVAAVPEERFDTYIEEVQASPAGELTTAGLLRGADKPHVARASGENEWYTPKEYVEAARTVLGNIELDPASSDEADAVVRAQRYYSIEDDGLQKHWEGCLWMNPPYASDLVGKFAAKLVRHYVNGDVPAAVVLVNNATETAWFQELAGCAAALCFPERRVRFWSPGGEAGAPLQGQAVIYLGKNIPVFKDRFDPFGLILYGS